MGKIVSGFFSLLLALAGLLYVVGCEVRSPEPWFLQKIPFFFGIDLPRVLFLGLAGMWGMGAIGAIATGFQERAAVGGYAASLRGGKTARDLLAAYSDGLTWSTDIHRGAAKCILQDISYGRTIAALVRKSNEPLDKVVLSYKGVIDNLTAQTVLIRQAAAKIGKTADDLPPLHLPAARVIASPGLFSGLNSNDLIFSLNDQLIESVDQYLAAAANVPTDTKMKLAVMRYVQTTFNNPLTGIANDFAWTIVSVEIKPDVLKPESLTNNADIVATPAPVLPAAKDIGPGITQPVATTDGPEAMLRFQCPQCGKALKGVRKNIGKTVTCPQQAKGCGTKFVIPDDKPSR